MPPGTSAGIEHLVDGNRMFACAVTAVEAEPPPCDCLEAYMQSTEAVRLAWGEPGVLDRDVTVPFGTFPGTVAIRMHFVDHLVHGWDLAKATGQDTTIEERLATAAYEGMTGALDESARGPGRRSPLRWRGATTLPSMSGWWPSSGAARERHRLPPTASTGWWTPLVTAGSLAVSVERIYSVEYRY